MSDRLALSALDWWQEAGVDVLVDEAPRDWLAAPPAAPSSAAPSSAVMPAAPAPAAPAALPADLPAFHAWLATAAELPGPPAARIAPAGDPGTGTMVVADMPEREDRAAGMLLSGEAGALFDRMLGAIGLARGQLYLVPMAPVRPAAGRLGEAELAALGRLLRHHILLARPRRLLLLGEAPARVLLGRSVGEARGRVHALELDGVSVPTVATFHPRLVLIDREQRKPVWADLQLFAGS